MPGEVSRNCSKSRCRQTVSAGTGFSERLQLALIGLLFLTGILMALAYTPVPGTAYDSVDYFQFSLPFGDVVRGVHHYAWNLLLMAMGLHLLRALVVGAYKSPRQPVWISGVLFLLVIAAFYHHGRPAALGPEGILVDSGALQHHRLHSGGR